MKTNRRSPIPTLLLATLVAVTFTGRSAAREPVSESINAAGAVTIDVAAYANLCGRLEYRTNEDGETNYWSKMMLGTKMKAGKPIYLEQEYDEGGHPNDQQFFSADLSHGLYQTGGLNDYGRKTEETWFWKPSVPMLRKVFVPGVAYTSRHTRSDMRGTPIDLRMVAVEDTISVPYGKGLKCYKVTQTFTFDGEKYVFQAWYAKHLGLVKRIQEDGTLWELASYQPAPWLVVEQPARSSLFDGAGGKGFGTSSVGKPGVVRNFTVRNLGTKALTGLAVGKNGSHSADFIVSTPMATSLAPGKATTFKVTFKPTAKGSRKAAIHVAHDDAGGNPFDIKLTGLGVK